jgi:hypothetical protein
MRRDLTVLRRDVELIMELRMPAARRQDRCPTGPGRSDQALAIRPAPERAFDLLNRGPLVAADWLQGPGGLAKAGRCPGW